MDEAIPWGDLLRIVNRYYRRADDNGRPKMPAERISKTFYTAMKRRCMPIAPMQTPRVRRSSKVGESSGEFPAKLLLVTHFSEKDKEWNRKQSRVRAFGEHPFQVVTCLWHHDLKSATGDCTKTPASSSLPVFSLLCALTNIFKLRHQLAPS